MSPAKFKLVLAPDVIAAFVVIAISVFLLSKTAGLPAESSQFPSAVLRVMILLAVVLGSRDIIRNWAGSTTRDVFKNRGRFLRTATVIVIYAVAVDTIGFYSSTVIMLPVTAFLFGYQHRRNVAITTISLVGALLILFTLLMGREFPTEFFLR